MQPVRKRKTVEVRRGNPARANAIAEQYSDSTIRVLGYLRVSDIKSAQGEISIPDQKERIIRWCEERGYEITAFYVDNGRTATTDKRKFFQKMISDIESGKYTIKHIVAYDSSRLFRNRLDFGQYENRLSELGITIQNTTQNFSRTVAGVMSRNIIAEFDQYLPMVTSVRVKEAQLALARQGYWPGGRTCYGIETYVVERHGKKVRRKLRPQEGEAAVVRSIFDICLFGNDEIGPSGAGKIAEWLYANNFTTRSGGHFSQNIVHRILTDPAYTGAYTWNYQSKYRPFVEGDEDKEVFEFQLERIVDQETFDRVQIKLRSQAPRKRNDTWVNQGSLLLREIAVCTCGSHLGLATGTGRDGEARRYYLCNRRKKVGRLACSAERVNEQVLDNIVLNSLKGTILDPERLGKLLKAWSEMEATSHAKRLEAAAQTVAKADVAERELLRLLRLAKADDDLATDGLFLKELSLARKAAFAARSELATVAHRDSGHMEVTPENVAVFAGMMRALLDGSDRIRTKAYLRSIISRIEVSEAMIRIIGDQEILRELVATQGQDSTGHSYVNDASVRNSMQVWYAQGESNPCSRRERAVS